jgi:hypothetical protein
VPTISPRTHSEWWARFALPTLVIAKSFILDVFRKEWPAADCNPRQAAGDRIEPHPELLLAAP